MSVCVCVNEGMRSTLQMLCKTQIMVTGFQVFQYFAVLTVFTFCWYQKTFSFISISKKTYDCFVTFNMLTLLYSLFKIRFKWYANHCILFILLSTFLHIHTHAHLFVENVVRLRGGLWDCRRDNVSLWIERTLSTAASQQPWLATKITAQHERGQQKIGVLFSLYLVCWLIYLEHGTFHLFVI